jgi:hypothetical protein
MQSPSLLHDLSHVDTSMSTQTMPASAPPPDDVEDPEPPLDEPPELDVPLDQVEPGPPPEEPPEDDAVETTGGAPCPESVVFAPQAASRRAAAAETPCARRTNRAMLAPSTAYVPSGRS